MISSELHSILRVVTPEEKKILDGDEGINKNIYMDNTTDIINSKKMLCNGKLIALRPHTRFAHFPEHSHDYVEIIYMCSGSTVHIVDGNELELREGELLFLCQRSKHEILPAGVNDIAVNFIVLPEFFDNALQMMGEEKTPLRRFIVECLHNSNENTGYLHFEVSDILPVQNLVENLIWTLINEPPDTRSINRITMGLLFLQLINCTDRLVSGYENKQLVVKVLGYIEENYKIGSLKELAEKLHYDTSTLSREIKLCTGKTYTELVREKRLARATLLLKTTDMTVEKIAEKLGYENFSFFFRIFKEQYGVSPKKYRKAQGIFLKKDSSEKQ